jgi:hypothetical protein
LVESSVRQAGNVTEDPPLVSGLWVKDEDLPRLYVTAPNKPGGYRYLRLARRVDLDRLLFAMQQRPGLFRKPTPVGDALESYKNNSWSHLNPYKISFLFDWEQLVPAKEQEVTSSIAKEPPGLLAGCSRDMRPRGHGG